MVFARWLCVLALLGVAPGVDADVAIPPLKARVTDLTGTLTPAQRGTLERELYNFEKRKGSQIAVLIVPTTKPEAIEQYSIRVVEAWKLGRKGSGKGRIDDGVLLLIAKNDRAMRIEVGYGLEGAIPDAIANRVIDDVIVPFFKQGDFYGGIQAGIGRLIRLIDGEPLPPPQARDNSWAGIQNLLPFAFIAAVVGGGLLRALFGRLIGSSLAGGIVGIAFWAIVGSLFASLIGGIAVFLFVLMAGLRAGPGIYGGWSGGGWAGGGGFGGGGGFSGGGGGFGGGGASGSW